MALHAQQMEQIVEQVLIVREQLCSTALQGIGPRTWRRRN